MFERFTDRARRVIVLAQEEARMLDHNYIGTEHILLGLLHEGQGPAAEALGSMGISLEEVRSEVEEIIGRGQSAPAGHIPFTPRAKKVLELSLREALELGHNYIGAEHILLGLIREGEGVGAQVLRKLGARADQARREVMRLLGVAEGATSEVRPPVDPTELILEAGQRARRARELAERLATAVGDPSLSADDVLLGFLVLDERLLGLEMAVRRLEEGGPTFAKKPTTRKGRKRKL